MPACSRQAWMYLVQVQTAVTAFRPVDATRWLAGMESPALYLHSGCWGYWARVKLGAQDRVLESIEDAHFLPLREMADPERLASARPIERDRTRSPSRTCPAQTTILPAPRVHRMASERLAFCCDEQCRTFCNAKPSIRRTVCHIADPLCNSRMISPKSPSPGLGDKSI